MTKKELIDAIVAFSKEGSVSVGPAAVKVVLNGLADVAESKMGAREPLVLPGIGTLTLKDRKERQGRNPRTGETIAIPAKRVVSFKPAKALADAVN